MVGIALVLAIGACDGGPSPNVDELHGTKIAFVSDRDSNNPDTMGNIEIYVMNADGSGQTRLTSGSAINCCPSWSPDGTKIAFSYSPGFVINNLMAPYKIDTMNADGSDRARLTDNSAIDLNPSWSPDGSMIAFSSDRDGKMGRWTVPNEIYVMNADGSNQTRLTNNPADDTEPSWSPRRSNTKSR